MICKSCILFSFPSHVHLRWPYILDVTCTPTLALHSRCYCYKHDFKPQNHLDNDIAKLNASLESIKARQQHNHQPHILQSELYPIKGIF